MRVKTKLIATSISITTNADADTAIIKVWVLLNLPLFLDLAVSWYFVVTDNFCPSEDIIAFVDKVVDETILSSAVERALLSTS